MRALVKNLTVDQFNNIEKNESNLFWKRFSLKILFNRIKLRKTKTKHPYIA